VLDWQAKTPEVLRIFSILREFSLEMGWGGAMGKIGELIAGRNTLRKLMSRITHEVMGFSLQSRVAAPA
jgi:ABC-type polysaccharide/polyol phosphate transport system ATPase subunit